MKNAKKIIAILLVVSLVSGIGIHQYGLRLSASEEDGVQVAEEQQEQAKEEPAEKADNSGADKQEQNQGGEAEKTPEEQNGDGSATAEEIDNPVNEETVDEQEATEEEVKMPTQSFKGSAGGITVVVNAPEGAFPEGTKMHVKALSDARALNLAKTANSGATNAQGVDVTFTKDGKEIQPEKAVSVKLAGADVEGEDFGICHIGDNGVADRQSSNATGNGGTIKVDHFTEIIIYDTGDPIKLSFGEKGKKVSPTAIAELNDDPAYTKQPVEGKATFTLPALTDVHDQSGKHGFLGWILEKDIVNSTVISSEQQYNKIKDNIKWAGDSYTITEDTTLYALWGNGFEPSPQPPAPTTYTVTYDLNGGTSATTQLVYPNLEAGDETPTIEEPTREYHSFTGWAPEVSPTVTGDVTYVAQWVEAQKHTVSFNANGGKGAAPDAITAYEDSQITLPEYTGTKAGFDFVGWSKNPDATVGVDKIYKAGDKYTIGNEDETLYAVWGNKVTVTFDKNGGSTNPDPASITKFRGETVALPDYTGKNGQKVFVGWSPDKNATAGGASHYTQPVYPAGYEYALQENVTLYATWAEKDCAATFYIRLDGLIPTEPQSHPSSEYTSGINIDKAIKIGEFYAKSDGDGVKDHLNKWPTDAQIKSVYKSYDPDSQYVLWYVIKKEDVWHVDGVLLSKGKVNLAYDPNAEKDWANMPDGQQYNIGATATVDPKVPTRTGYTFDKWNTKADGTGTSYTGGDTFTINSNTTLYAQWIFNARYTVEYYYEKDSGGYALDHEASRTGLTGGTVEVTAADKTPKTNAYYFDDENAGNVLSGTVLGDGSLELKVYFNKKKAINITAKSDSKTYDGTALTNNGYSYTGKLAQGDELTATVSGTITNAGTVNNVVTGYQIMNGNKDVTSHYTITTSKGTLTVNKVNITLKSESDSKTYDGTVLKKEAVNITKGAFVGNQGVEYKDFASIKKVGEVNNTYNYTAKPGTNLNNYNITKEFGTLEVTAKAVTVKADDKSKVYGTSDPTLTAKVSGLVEGEPASLINYNVTRAAGENVGKYAITASGAKVQGNYTVTYEPGTFTITKSKALTVTGAPYDKPYDGNTHGSAATTNIPEGTTISYSTDGGQTWSDKYPTIKEVDEITVTVKAENPNYETVTDTYTLKVTYKAVTVKADNKTKVYGDTDPQLTATVNGLIGQDTVDYNLSRVQGEDVGDYTITPAGAAIQGNYSVTYDTGTLTITAAGTLTVTGTDYSDDYDGNTHGVAAVPSITAGTTVKYSIDGGKTWDTEVPTIKNVGKITVLVKAENKNYKTATTDYVLEVTPKAVTVTADNKSKTYGTDDPTFTADVNGTIGGDAIQYSLDREAGTDVGEYAITPSGAKLQGNYSVTYEKGTLTINKSNAMTVSGTPYNKKYDGASHGDAATPSVAQGTTVKYSTNGGTSWSTAVPSIKDFGTVNVQVKTENKNYYDANCSYVLNVMKRDVTITSGDASKTYDGSPLVNGNISVGKDGFVSGEGATYNVTGSQLDAGNSPNTFAYALKANTKNTNYNIEKTEGTLTVKPIATEIVITAKDKEKMYDGTPLTEAGFIYTPNVLVAGDTLTAVVDGTITDFGTEANVVKSYQVKRGDNVVTGNYTFGTSVDGVLSITKRPVTLTSASDSKIYDGLPLTNHNVTAGGEGFASGEGATYDVTGSQTELGNSPNYFSYTLNPGTDENNYNITKVEGTLIVAEIVGEISVITTGGEFTYDGKPHGGEVTVVGLPDGFSVATAKSNTTATHVADGTVDVTCDRLAIKDKAGKIIVIRDEGPTEEEGIYEDETYVSASSAQAVSASPLTIKYYNDTVKIKPATMTVTTDSATKTYDGTALKANGHVRGLVKGETVGFKTTGSRTDVGSSKNTYTLVWGSFFNTQTAHKSDYKVKENLGTLTINAAAGPVPTPAGPLAAVQRMLGIDDGDTPLANMDKNHGCCMLHLLLMLAALIVLIGYTKSMKRRQEEIFELRRKVGERAKKQGVSK